MTAEWIRDHGFELISGTELENRIRKALETIENFQKGLCTLADKEDENSLTLLKIGTILTFAIIKKRLNNKENGKFSKEDWADIAKAVGTYAVCMENQAYSEFVFLLYAEYIDFSLAVIADRISERAKSEICMLSQELRDKTELLHQGALGETVYIEECLWTALDAMLKLLSSWFGMTLGDEKEQLLSAATSLAFELTRYRLLKKEQIQLDACLEHQRELDEQLRCEYNAFLNELCAETDRFMDLIKNAFDPDFRKALRSSAELAAAAGVCEEEILDTPEKIDEYFL